MFKSFRTFVSGGAVMIVVAGCAGTVAPRPSPMVVAQACTGISEAQARGLLADLRSEVDEVNLARATMNTKPFLRRSVGVDIHVRAKSGMTSQWLARLVQCHVASEAGAGACVGSKCAFGLPIAATGVSSTTTGFIIEIRSSDSAVARELALRSKELLEPR